MPRAVEQPFHTQTRAGHSSVCFCISAVRGGDCVLEGWPGTQRLELGEFSLLKSQQPLAALKRKRLHETPKALSCVHCFVFPLCVCFFPALTSSHLGQHRQLVPLPGCVSRGVAYTGLGTRDGWHGRCMDTEPACSLSAKTLSLEAAPSHMDGTVTGDLSVNQCCREVLAEKDCMVLQLMTACNMSPLSEFPQ